MDERLSDEQSASLQAKDWQQAAAYLQEPLDVVIVGGGVIGLSLAYALLKRSAADFRRVMVLERDRIGHGSTFAAAGMIAPISEAEIQPQEVVDFGLESLALYPEFIAGLERLSGTRCGLRCDGALWVAADADDMAKLRHIHATQAEKGVVSTILGVREIRDREPYLTPRIAGGLSVECDAQVDARSLVLALARAVRSLGGCIVEGIAVEQITLTAGDHWSVTSSADNRIPKATRPLMIEAPRVVVAAGVWSDRDIKLPIDHLGLRPVKGQSIRLNTTDPGPVVSSVLRSPRVYLVPNQNGQLIIGASQEEIGFDDRPSAGVVMDLLRYAFRLIPGIYDMSLVETVVGLRPTFCDHMPAIGGFEDSSLAGFFVATGHYRDGILLAPATAYLLAEAMATGKCPAALEPFSPERESLARRFGTLPAIL